jgi:hypothetical protein
MIPDFLLRFSSGATAEASNTDDAASQKDERNELGLSRFSTKPTFGKDIRLLSDYSLITVSAETFDMAEPVQLATRAWLKSHSQLESLGTRICISNECSVPLSGWRKHHLGSTSNPATACTSDSCVQTNRHDAIESVE